MKEIFNPYLSNDDRDILFMLMEVDNATISDSTELWNISTTISAICNFPLKSSRESLVGFEPTLTSCVALRIVPVMHACCATSPIARYPLLSPRDTEVGFEPTDGRNTDSSNH